MLTFLTKPLLYGFALFDYLCLLVTYVVISFSDWGLGGDALWIVGSIAIHTYTSFKLKEAAELC